MSIFAIASKKSIIYISLRIIYIYIREREFNFESAKK